MKYYYDMIIQEVEARDVTGERFTHEGRVVKSIVTDEKIGEWHSPLFNSAFDVFKWCSAKINCLKAEDLMKETNYEMD